MENRPGAAGQVADADLVAESGVLVAEVRATKAQGSQHFVMVDAGFSDLMRPAMYEAWMAIVPCRQRDEAALTWDVVGPVCESGDWLARDRALAMFGKLRVWDTEHNNGVLIYLLLAERRIEIVADRGLMRHTSEAHWQAVLQALRHPLQQGNFESGLTQALEAVSALLVAHFPLTDSRPNELPDLIVRA